MIIRRADNRTEAGATPGRELLAAMGRYFEEMARAGILLACDGLHPTSAGVRVSFRDGRPDVTDGPFADACGGIGGYAMVQVRTRAEALEWAKRWPPVDGDGAAELELRQVYEVTDIGPEFSPDLRDREDQLRAATGRK